MDEGRVNCRRLRSLGSAGHKEFKGTLMKDDVSTTPQSKVPAHEMVYRKLRDLVLFGEIAPGQAVTIQGLTDRLDAGMTPVREAIRRLIAEGALDFQGNRRVCVPRLSVQNVNELIFARQAIEPQLILLATQHAAAQDIDYLFQIDERLDKAIKEMIDYDGPVIFDCIVDENENVFPMIPSGKAHNEMLLGDETEKEEISDEGKVLV